LTEIGNTGNGTYTPGDIDNTKTELLLMDSEEAGNPGIAQMISLIWPKIRELDMCVPGHTGNHVRLRPSIREGTLLYVLHMCGQ
jgi:hypothetical protein